MAKNTCSIDGCEKFCTGHGWCSAHYTRWRRYGDPQFRLAGEVRDGRRICPGCRVDKELSQYSASTGRCRPCVAAKKRATRPYVAIPLPRIRCIMCAMEFVPPRGSIYCCSEGCSAERKRAMDAYYGLVDGNYQSKLRWQQANPDARLRTENRRRARKRGSQNVAISAVDLAARMSYFGNICWMCGGPFECLDHVKPIAKGGPHLLANLRPACASCNSSKSAKWPGVQRLSELIA